MEKALLGVAKKGRRASIQQVFDGYVNGFTRCNKGSGGMVWRFHWVLFPFLKSIRNTRWNWGGSSKLEMRSLKRKLAFLSLPSQDTSLIVTPTRHANASSCLWPTTQLAICTCPWATYFVSTAQRSTFYFYSVCCLSLTGVTWSKVLIWNHLEHPNGLMKYKQIPVGTPFLLCPTH